MGSLEARIEGDRPFEEFFGCLVGASAPIEISQLQERLRVVRGELQVPPIGIPRRLPTFLTDERGAQIGKNRGILAVAELKRRFEGSLRFRPTFDPKQQAPVEAMYPGLANAPPSHPPCHATTATEITAGRYGGLDLAGSRFVTLGPETWVALYFDEAMNEPRRRAILGIFRSLAPGAPQRYRAIRRVPLSITEARSPAEVIRRAVIPGILEMETTLPLEDGRLAGRIPGMDVWSNEIAYGRTGAYRFHDPAIPTAWDHGRRQSNAKEFTPNLGMYREGRMLIQHADGSGDWTDPQRAIFRAPGPRLADPLPASRTAAPLLPERRSRCGYRN